MDVKDGLVGQTEVLMDNSSESPGGVPRRPPPSQQEMDAYLAGLDFTDCEPVYLPRADFDGPLRKAIVDALPRGAGFCFNYEGDRAWVLVGKPAITSEIVERARAALGR